MAQGLNDIPLSGLPDQQLGTPFYSEAGDCLFVYFENAESYRDRVDDVLTVYRAFDDDRVVGCQVKGIGALFEVFGDFGIEYTDKGKTINLGVVFLVSNLVAKEPIYDYATRSGIYSGLANRAGRKRFDVPEFSH